MTTTMNRRRFLVMGCGVVVSAVCAGCGLVAAQAATESSTEGSAADSTGTTQSVRTACPKGLVKDPYPGRCRLYRDSNGSGYCDLSETA
jgi:hypothetical protein